MKKGLLINRGMFASLIFVSLLNGCKSSQPQSDSEAKDFAVRNGSALTGTFIVPAVSGQKIGKRDFCIYETVWHQNPGEKPNVVSTKLLFPKQFNESQVANWFIAQKDNAQWTADSKSRNAILYGLFGFGCVLGAPACIGALSIGGLLALKTVNSANYERNMTNFENSQYRESLGADSLTKLRKFENYDHYRGAKALVVEFVAEKLDTKSNGSCDALPQDKGQFEKSLSAAAKAL